MNLDLISPSTTDLTRDCGGKSQKNFFLKNFLRSFLRSVCLSLTELLCKSTKFQFLIRMTSHQYCLEANQISAGFMWYYQLWSGIIWNQLVSFGFVSYYPLSSGAIWYRKGSSGIICYYLLSFGIIWYHLVSFGIIRYQLVSLGINWYHLA